MDHVDKVIVTAYQDPWLGSQPQPLAPLDWFRAQVAQIQRDVPAAKLVIAVGGHAVDWVSGQAVPDRISMAEAMFRISRAKASIDFSPAAKNSYASFFDRDGNRHQIWMLDAASVHNNLRVLRDLGITEVAVASLGEEEPAYWDALGGRLLNGRLAVSWRARVSRQRDLHGRGAVLPACGTRASRACGCGGWILKAA